MAVPTKLLLGSQSTHLLIRDQKETPRPQYVTEGLCSHRVQKLPREDSNLGHSG